MTAAIFTVGSWVMASAWLRGTLQPPLSDLQLYKLVPTYGALHTAFEIHTYVALSLFTPL